MVFYRKYRPQTIDELDSDSVKQTLKSVLSQKEIPHAFLFTGPKGLGKTSIARIVAKYVNCQGDSEKGKDSKKKPCNVCASCVSITNGTNIDVLEIDGASNRGIDEMRDLREKIRLLPSSSQKKVYIIDEVHMLTTEAFNALLKTLEEPPAHAMFILCTTEPHKVPATIVSRCFHIQFKKATTSDLVSSFERIMNGENISYEKEGLEAVAAFADGSFRDGAKVLEELVLGLSGKMLTKAYVQNQYHVQTLDQHIQELLGALLNKDAKKGLTVLQTVNDEGIDIRYFIEKVLFTLHHILLVRAGVEQDDDVVSFEMFEIESLVNAFSVALMQIKYAVLPQLPLEIAVVAWCTKEEVQIMKFESGMKEEKVVSQQKEQITKQGTVPVSSHAAHDTSALLFQIVDGVKKENHMLAGVLRGCKIASLDEHTLVIEALSSFHRERLRDQKALEVLEKVCENITGKKISVKIILKGGE